MNDFEYHDDREGKSPTSIVCDHIRMFVAKPDRDELDSRQVWDRKDAIFHRLEKARTKYRDMVLVHGGTPGIEKTAASWADRNGVHQVVCKPDWDRHGNAAPFRCNDELLNLLSRGVIAFPGSGITDNLVDKAITLGIPVQRCAAA